MCMLVVQILHKNINRDAKLKFTTNQSPMIK